MVGKLDFASDGFAIIESLFFVCTCVNDSVVERVAENVKNDSC